MKKIMRVNLSESKFKVEDMPKEYQGLFLRISADR